MLRGEVQWRYRALEQKNTHNQHSIQLKGLQQRGIRNVPLLRASWRICIFSVAIKFAIKSQEKRKKRNRSRRWNKVLKKKNKTQTEDISILDLLFLGACLLSVLSNWIKFNARRATNCACWLPISIEQESFVSDILKGLEWRETSTAYLIPHAT